MNKIIISSIITFFTLSSFSSQSFVCTNIANIEENTVDIDLANGTAGFFDNDTWTTTQRKSVETTPNVTKIVFEGPDKGANKTLRIVFTSKRVRDQQQYMVELSDIDGKNESVENIGSGPCRARK